MFKQNYQEVIMFDGMADQYSKAFHPEAISKALARQWGKLKQEEVSQNAHDASQLALLVERKCGVDRHLVMPYLYNLAQNTAASDTQH